MGLDMYLTKTKRVKGLKAKDYALVENSIPSNFDKTKGLSSVPELADIEGVNELTEMVKSQGEWFSYMSILTELEYWRKSNAIHQWFVANCQKGVDNCQLAEVKKMHLVRLLKVCKEILADNSKAKDLLPTQSGFFFGGTDYDQWYFEDIKRTAESLEKILKEVDFKVDIVFYRSSW